MLLFHETNLVCKVLLDFVSKFSQDMLVILKV